MTGSDRTSGFTLVEMMVALFIFGLLASSAVMLLRFAVDSQVQSKSRLDEIADTRRFTAVWNADMAEAVPRLSRDQTGQLRAAFQTQDASDPTLLIRLIRGGWTNFDDSPRSSQQVVEYHLVDGNLERRTQARLDGGQAGDGSVLVTGVTDMKLRYRDEQGNWTEIWRPKSPGDMPAAAEMTLTRASGKGAEPQMRLLALVAPNFRADTPADVLDQGAGGQNAGGEGTGGSNAPVGGGTP